MGEVCSSIHCTVTLVALTNWGSLIAVQRTRQQAREPLPNNGMHLTVLRAPQVMPKSLGFFKF